MCIRDRFTVASLVAVTLGSVLFNVPRFLRLRPRSIDGPVTGGRRKYFAYPRPLFQRADVERAYSWTYFALGIVVPLLVLVFSNARLIVALRRSKKLRVGASGRHHPGSVEHGDHDHDGDRSARRITLTLVVIVVFFVVLFVPAELLNFFAEHAVGDAYRTDVFNAAQAVGNLLQAANFAVNFVLYCVVNTHFRRTVYGLVRCGGGGGRRSPKGDRLRRRARDPETMNLRSRGGATVERAGTVRTSSVSMSVSMSLSRSRVSAPRLIFSSM